VINSPNIESTKFWPGDLGLHATHAVVHANLILKGKNYGIHSFFMQIRD